MSRAAAVLAAVAHHRQPDTGGSDHMKIENAKIRSTFLGVEDHGILSAMIHLEGAGWGVGFGGMALDGPVHEGGKFVGRRGTAFGMEWVRGLLAALGVESWEKLPSTFVRVETEGWGGKALRIGHITDDRWFDLKHGVEADAGGSMSDVLVRRDLDRAQAAEAQRKQTLGSLSGLIARARAEGFAAGVAQEREACAKECEAEEIRVAASGMGFDATGVWDACAAAIRARGSQP